MGDVISILRQCGIQPTPQRVAVVEWISNTKSHPTADEVLTHARKKCPTVSRATVYNTLNLLVTKGMLRMQIIREGTVVFDPNIEDHHHFIDDETGAVYDIPWEDLRVTGEENLKGFDIREYQVILRGKRKKQ